MSSASKLEIIDTKIESFDMTNDFHVFEHSKETEIKVEIETAFSDVSEKEITTIRLDLSIEVDSVTSDNEEQTTIKLNQVSLYRYEDDDLNAEQVMNEFGLNMISIAYPYARSYVNGVTALAGIPAIELPTINVLNIVTDDIDE